MTPAADDKFDEFQITDSIPSDGKFGSKGLFSIMKHNAIAFKSQISHDQELLQSEPKSCI